MAAPRPAWPFSKAASVMMCTRGGRFFLSLNVYVTDSKFNLSMRSRASRTSAACAAERQKISRF